MDVVALLGSTLRKPDGSTVSTAEAVGSKAVLALYFSAHWCPPCRGFTPTLSEKYIDLQDEEKDFEMVFVSSDKDEKAFEEYHGEMTFLALPYAERNLKAKLSKKYKVSGIPTLVFVDLKTGKLITDNGREAISQNDYIEKFPYNPEKVDILATLGDTLLNPDGSKVSTKDVAAGKILGLYFSAHWCPPCRAFTPTLSEKYTALKAAGKDFELVFVSSDRNEGAFKEYHGEMTFLAMPFERRQEKEKLSNHFGVSGIPSLIFVDAAGEIITSSARGAISTDSFVEDFPYYPKPVNDLGTTADGINDSVSLVVLMDQASKEKQDAATKVLVELAEKEKKKPEDEQVLELFFTATGGGPVGQIKSNCGYSDAGKEPVMLILDLADEGAYYHPAEGKGAVTEDNIEAFALALKEGTLTKKQFGN